jgi:hypothetical protein
MGRFRARRRLVSATLALAALPAGATTVLGPGGSGEQRFTALTPVAVTPTRTPHHVKSPVQSTPPPGTVSLEPAGPPYPLQLYLERRGARWVVTRIADT